MATLLLPMLGKGFIWSTNHLNHVHSLLTQAAVGVARTADGIHLER